MKPFLVALIAASHVAIIGAQWPQWRGPNRDGVVAAANVPASWPASPTLKWTQKVGEGYSTPVVADGRIFVHSRQDPDEVVTALDLATGKPLWTARYAASFNKNKYANEMSKGPFSTPLVAKGIVYTLGTTAVLSAFDATTGAVKWRKDWSKAIDTSKLFTGTAMSPIGDSGLLIVHVGDDTEGAFRAFDPATGAERWSLPGHGPGYASPIVAALGGTRQLITMTDKAVVGVAVADGKQLWQIPFPDEWNENIVTPAVAGDVLIVSGTRKGTFGYRITRTGAALAPVQVWHNADVPMYMSSPVVDGAFVYGFSNRRKGQIFCVDAATGTLKWATEGRGGANASLQIAGPNLIVLTTDGDLLVVKKNPEKFEELHRYKVADSQTWAQPVLLGRELLIRNATAVSLWSLR
ncbi:MAG TPA: PQQ-binding-like beta-propeller repeat protein [Vicinamibacterales bacterium]|nr:PQQ-binding-like beta-propeller repeat protein [Vicinamibacterales bacterium]